MSLLKTPVNAWHHRQGAKMVEFGGWEMPIQYSAITPEHHAVRRTAGLFDIAHMGRLKFTGPDAEAFLNRITTNSVSALKSGQIQYSLVTNEQGGVLDDVLVYRLPSCHMLVVNASNRLKILDWIEQQRAELNFTLQDLTESWFMFALQGPSAVEVLSPFVPSHITELPYYWAAETEFSGHPAIISRTGYTGEDGFEVMLPIEFAESAWQAVFDAGQSHGLLAAGLGCRDTLRLEAAMPLYGHELNETTDPFTAGLAFAVKLDKNTFIGREALVQAKSNPSRPKRVGLELAVKRIAREGTLVYAADGRQVGHVTSGTASPTLDKSIAMAYLDADTAAVGSKLEVDIRGQRVAAQVVKLPFYKRATR